MIGSLARRLRRFRRSEDGNSTIEFVILFPAFIGIFLASFESGMMMVRNVMLERGVDLAVRTLRLTSVVPEYDAIKQDVCDNSVIFPNCMDLVHVEMAPVDMDNWDMPGVPRCIDQDPETDDSLNAVTGGGNNELMILRVCALFKPYFPGTVLGMQMPKYYADDGEEKYALIVTSAFVNEPTR